MQFVKNIMYKIFTFVRQCQSCGFTLSKDENKGGTEADGSLSKDYCSMCYNDGRFVHPDITPQQILQKLTIRYKQKGFSDSIVMWIINKTEKEMMTYKRWSSQ